MNIDGNHEFKYRLYSLLKTLPIHKDQIKYNGWFLCRCPFCGDSKRDRTHMHMGIGLNLDSYKAPGFKCMRCQAEGVLSNNVLEMLGLYDQDMPALINKYRSVAARKNIGFTGYEENKVQKLNLLAPAQDNVTAEKIRYIENRLGIQIDNEKIKKYRMVFNIGQFLVQNKVKTFTRHDMTMKSLDTRYVGFTTVNKEFLSCRMAIGEEDKYNKRWVVYNIFNLRDNTRKFYLIESCPNIMKKQTIIIAEGVFDIINIYEHIYHCDDKDKIYAASLGTSYRAILDFFFKKGLLFFDIIIYSDADIKLSFYKELKESLSDKFFGKMTVMYNTSAKDYGEKTVGQDRLISYKVK